LSRLIAVIAICIGLAFFAVGALIAVPFWQDFIFSIGIIIAMVPEGFLPTLTLSLVLAAQRIARRMATDSLTALGLGVERLTLRTCANRRVHSLKNC
jgi:magnesium-transporting ATPase (P-type)